MKRILLITIILIVLVACAKKDEDEEITYKSVSMEEGIKLMSTLDAFMLLDVRTAEEYAQGHIPAAMNYPNEDIGDQELSILPDKEISILVYCRSGRRSKEAASKLAKLGYKNIIEIGGIIDYPYELQKLVP